MSTEPPAYAIDVAVRMARLSPCAKSQRGVVVYSPVGKLKGCGFNHPVYGDCDGSDACRAACSKICEHAEAMVLRQTTAPGPLDMVHVKVVNGEPVPSGGPSCWQCSKTILADQRITGVWLLHVDGWRRYDIAGVRLAVHDRRRDVKTDAIARSLDAFRNAPPEQDALTAGAAAFFGVPYAEVTREQRAAWEWATSAMRQPDGTHVKREDAEPVKRALLSTWPALRAVFK